MPVFPRTPILRPLRLKPSTRRFFSTPRDASSRLHTLNNRLPPFLRKWTAPLLGAPGTHVTSFLILHEITAIVPLFGLVAAFHYGEWLPDLSSSGAFEEGTRRFGKWLRKKGWVGEEIEIDNSNGNGIEAGVDMLERSRGDNQGVKLVVEFATAYAITKALLPLRIAASACATPWFARTILGPVRRRLRGLAGRK